MSTSNNLLTKPLEFALRAFLFYLASFAVYATESESEYPGASQSQWHPMYEACMEKTGSMPELVKMKQTLNSGQLSPKDAEEVKQGIDEIETMFLQYCVCIKEKAHKGFQLSGYNISPIEITLLSAAFRFETLYPDKQVRELFGMSILPCIPF